MSDITVVGSINHDLTVMAERHPHPGETVIGLGHFSGAGGKGANQAVAAARLGSTVAMVGRVGADESGVELVDGLISEGVDTSNVEVDDGLPTGLALITLGAGAENTIVVSPGANSAVDPDQVDRAAGALTTAKVVLCQLEVPIEAVIRAAGHAGGLLLLNPAPGRRLPRELLDRVDVLIPNRTELDLVCGFTSTGPGDVIRSARAIAGQAAVVVTLGRDGAIVVEDGQAIHISAPTVEAVDTTGAGDAFCGALAAALARGLPLVEAARRATVAGALAATVKGAQASMPMADQVEGFIVENGLPDIG